MNAFSSMIYQSAKAMARPLVAVLALASPAVAEGNLTTITELVEPVCRTTTLPAETRHQILVNLGWKMSPDAAPVASLAAAQGLAQVVDGQVMPEEQADFVTAARTMIAKRLAAEPNPEKMVSRWFFNEANPALGMMLTTSNTQGFAISTCEFVLPVPDDRVKASLTALFALARPHVTELGTAYKTNDTHPSTQGRSILMEALFFIGEAATPVAVLSITNYHSP